MENKFEKLYKELYKDSNQILEKAKKEKNKKILITLLVCILVIVLIKIISNDDIIFLFSIIVSIIIMSIVITIEKKKYTQKFKNNIIKELVKKYNSKLNFIANGKISTQEYSISKFDNSFDEMYTEDKISGIIGENTDFQMVQLVTKEERIVEDDAGNESKQIVETFKGIYGIVSLEKNTKSDIYIASNSITRKYSKDRVEMDSQEFEQNYDCITKDKINAMKILTSDLLEKFVNLRSGNLKNFQLKIKDDFLFFRCACGEMFEPPKFKEALNKEIIKKYYNVISLPVEIVEKILENIKLL